MTEITITEDNRARMFNIFDSLSYKKGPQSAHIDKEQFMQFMGWSRLGTNVIEKIWSLVEGDMHGLPDLIDKFQFAVAMMLATHQRTVIGGRGDVQKLPQSLANVQLIGFSEKPFWTQERKNNLSERHVPEKQLEAPPAVSFSSQAGIAQTAPVEAQTTLSSRWDAIDSRISALLPRNDKASPSQPLTESACGQISELLKAAGKEDWSRVPRTYAVCRLTDQLDSMNAFVGAGCSDFWLPYTRETLPNAISNPEARARFLESQGMVLSASHDLEDSSKRGHTYFATCDDVPLQSLEQLGQGGFGWVDKVESSLSFKVYARKLISRKRTFKDTKEVLQDFERELATLQRVSHQHRHIINLIGSYTCPKYVGLLMHPVCETDLDTFLEQSPLEKSKLSLLRTFYGCITAALVYLHDNLIRHKDIKPRNILVNKGQIYLTDFGLSRDSSAAERATTTGPPAALSRRYAAPEVAGWEARSYESDIWSLGCVFLEMSTVLLGKSMNDMNSFVARRGTRDDSFWANSASFKEWVELLLSEAGKTEDAIPLHWVAMALRENRQDRPSARELFVEITDPGVATKQSFCGLCCIEDD